MAGSSSWGDPVPGPVTRHLRNRAISESRRYAQLANAILKTDGPLQVLLGRLALIDGDCETACGHPEQALQLKTTPGQVLPYLAKARFRLRDMSALHLLIRRFASLRDLPNIGPVARFWMKPYEH